MDGRGAGCGGDDVGAFGPGENGYLPRPHVGNQHGNHKGRNFVGPGFKQLGVVRLQGMQAPEADAEDHGHIVSIGLGDFKAGVLQQHLGRGHGKLGEAVHAPHLFGRHILLGHEVLHFAGDA